jgi:hypothetical protein
MWLYDTIMRQSAGFVATGTRLIGESGFVAMGTRLIGGKILLGPTAQSFFTYEFRH